MIKMNSFEAFAPKGERLLIRAQYASESGSPIGEVVYGIATWNGLYWDIEGTADDHDTGLGLTFVRGWCRLSDLDGDIEHADIEGPIR